MRHADFLFCFFDLMSGIQSVEIASENGFWIRKPAEFILNAIRYHSDILMDGGFQGDVAPQFVPKWISIWYAQTPTMPSCCRFANDVNHAILMRIWSIFDRPTGGANKTESKMTELSELLVEIWLSDWLHLVEPISNQQVKRIAAMLSILNAYTLVRISHVCWLETKKRDSDCILDRHIRLRLPMVANWLHVK